MQAPLIDNNFMPLQVEIFWPLALPPKVNIIVWVHGNEQAPLKAINLLKKEIWDSSLLAPFRIIFANPQAIHENKRYIHTDLNNAFLDQWWDSYESLIASSIAPFLSDVAYTFDFHSTSFPISGPYALISIYSREKLAILSKIWIQNAVFVEKNSLIKKAVKGIGFEVWYDKEEKSIQTALQLMRNILQFFGILDSQTTTESTQAHIHLVYDILKKEDFWVIEKNIQDFQFIEKWTLLWIWKENQPIYARENFYPLWVEDPQYIRMTKRIFFEE